MRLHVPALPHTQTVSRDFPACAYTTKVRLFCRMMVARGHQVFLYAGDRNDAECTEWVKVFTEAERVAWLGEKHYTQGSFNPLDLHWRQWTGRVMAQILERKQAGDFLCIIGGVAMQPLSTMLYDMPAVEFGIGYAGTFAFHRVFESYAWMHAVTGAQDPQNVHRVQPRWYDAVIPNYIDTALFPVKEKPGDYLLFVGRLIELKGVEIAKKIARATKRGLIIAGPGDRPEKAEEGIEYVGEVGPKKCGQLMAGARALLAPTQYLEPFGTVAIEAQACGTPVISTDWGGFTETVAPGVSGFRCRDMTEFVNAVHDVGSLDRATIAERARSTWCLERIGGLYEDYFARIQRGMTPTGWDTLPPAPAVPA